MTDQSPSTEPNFLSASGVTKTNGAYRQWVGDVVKEAQALFGDRQLKAWVWAYREQGCDYLSCDLFGGDESLPVTLAVSGKLSVPPITGGAAEAQVYDMPDALHVAGMITRALNTEVVLGRE